MRQLDARGLLCPEPIMLLHQAIHEAQKGDELSILTTDPAALRDVPQFCRFLGHALLATESREEYVEFRLRVGTDDHGY
jgi:tRNA 2-thiouridine synthesizing protein A